MKVKQLLCFEEKKAPGKNMTSIELKEGKGILGDVHADGGEKQITIMSIEGREKMKNHPKAGLCFKRYKENIQTEGLDLARIETGDVLEAGGAQIEMSKEKTCWPEDCQMARDEEFCPLKESATFGKVKRSGVISVGDEVIIVKKTEKHK